MNEIRRVKAEIKLKEWTGLIAECQASTQTVKAWCLEHDINPKSYYYWLRKIRLRALQNMPGYESEVPVAQHDNEISFKPLEIEGPAPAADAAVTVRLPNATLEVTRGADRETIEAVLLALKTVC